MAVIPLTAISAAVPTIHLMTRMMATFKSALVTMCSRRASIRAKRSRVSAANISSFAIRSSIVPA